MVHIWTIIYVIYICTILRGNDSCAPEQGSRPAGQRMQLVAGQQPLGHHILTGQQYLHLYHVEIPERIGEDGHVCSAGPQPQGHHNLSAVHDSQFTVKSHSHANHICMLSRTARARHGIEALTMQTGGVIHGNRVLTEVQIARNSSYN